MNIEAMAVNLVNVNAPEWFKEKEFLAWLNDKSNLLMSWHEKGSEAGEYSDTVVMVDSSLSGEGSDQDSMPTKYWDFIIKTCKDHFGPSAGHHIIVKITNLQY
ncbi:MAG: hypothetical protein RPS47_11730 [Colwellia sp.]|jgi:hypothetical protein